MIILSSIIGSSRHSHSSFPDGFTSTQVNASDSNVTHVVRFKKNCTINRPTHRHLSCCCTRIQSKGSRARRRRSHQAQPLIGRKYEPEAREVPIPPKARQRRPKTDKHTSKPSSSPCGSRRECSMFHWNCRLVLAVPAFAAAVVVPDFAFFVSSTVPMFELAFSA